MKKMIVALLATGLMGSAMAQSTAPSKRTQPQVAPAPAPAAVAGTKTATTQSLGELTPYAVIVGAVAVGAVIAATSGGSSHKSTPTTGTK